MTKQKYKFKRVYAGCYRMVLSDGDHVYVERSMDDPNYWMASNVEGYFKYCEEAKASARVVAQESEMYQ